MLIIYIFPLNNIFLHETNTFDCVTVGFSVENCVCSKVPVAGSKVYPGWGSFKQNAGVIKMGSVIKMIRSGQFAYYGNAVVYVSVCCNYLFLLID
jgi:hypothetical protein